MEKELLEKIKSIVYGHAVGDALGVPVEFKSRNQLKTKPVVDMLKNGTYNMPKGTWSDDTSMSLCALNVLSKGDNEIDYQKIMENFCKWFYYGEFTATDEMFDCGNTCCEAIENYNKNKIKPLDCGLSNEFSNGNGSLMRIYPFVLYSHFKKLSIQDKVQIISNGSRLTHANECSIIGCIIYSYIMWELLEDPCKDSIFIGLEKAKQFYLGNAKIQRYNRIFSGNFACLDEDSIKSSGFVVDSLEAAIWCLLNSENYKDCVLKAVNLGNDTDTIAAISGSLAGLCYGLENIPKEWIDNLKKKNYIDNICQQFCKSF